MSERNFTAEPNHERVARHRTFERMRRVVDTFVTDYQEEERGRDVRVDTDLRDGIATLLSMGINTEQSCWGHPERRKDMPRYEPDPEDIELGIAATLAIPPAEFNLLPDIGCSGFLPTDGLDADGNSVGYTNEQVDAAYERAKAGHHRLAALLEQFYRQFPSDDPQIQLTFDDVPVFRLRSKEYRTIYSLPEEQQDIVIAQTRDEWAAFLAFLKESHLTDMNKTYIPVPYPDPAQVS